jgi:bifunctional UDP-N-acetylglucosamine pyrophosphorylase/glucosamine-1-phosphate N-acetyltransferase
MTLPPQPALSVVILAAGQGTRMKSTRPKVLQRLGGQALLTRVMRTAQALNARQCIGVVGHLAEQVEAAMRAEGFGAEQLQFVVQSPQLGTGHAVQQAAPLLSSEGVTLILSGDVPLTRAETLSDLVALADADTLALLTVDHPEPSGYGRIVRDAQDDILAIVEHKDANAAQRAIGEIYSGIMAVPSARLLDWLQRLDSDNAQNEYYLTDIVRFAAEDGVRIKGLRIDDPVQVEGVNSPQQLAALERAWQHAQAQALMAAGVRLADPARIDIRGHLRCGQDVEIDINCVFEGEVVLGDQVRIGAHCVLRNCHIEEGAVIHPFTHIDGDTTGVRVGARSLIGPYARLRPGAQLGQEVHVGNFVEIKNSQLADGAKANHLAYLGDAVVGERVNYGAGSITANYDGANKHRTTIEADVHVGSNCVLVAPVHIGAGGTVGAGSTVTKDTPAGALTVTRAKQIHIADWARPVKKAKR